MSGNDIAAVWIVQLLIFGSKTQACIDAMASKGKRRSNCSSPEELQRALKLHFPRGIDRQQPWNNLALDAQVVDAYESFLGEMLTLSTRPTKTWICKACFLCFPSGDKGLFNSFADRMCQVASFCFSKRLESTSGKKLSNPLKRLLKIIAGQEETCPASLGSSLFERSKRQLAKRKSEASTPSPKKRKPSSPVPSFGIAASSPGIAASSSGIAASSSSSGIQNIQSFYQNLLASTSSCQAAEKEQKETIDILSQETISSEEAPLPISSPGRKEKKGMGFWFDPAVMTFVRNGAEAGDVEPGECKAGENGFVLVRFGKEEWQQTELPVLEWKKTQIAKPAGTSKAGAKAKASGKSKAKAKAKAKASAKAKAKSKAVSKPSTDQAKTSGPAHMAAAPGSGSANAAFVKEYRTATNAYAIRKKWKEGHSELKRQIVELRHKDNVFSKEELMDMAVKAIHKLSVEKKPEADVIAWVKEQLKSRD